MQLIKLATIATLALTLTARSAQAETLEDFGQRVSRTTVAMLKNHGYRSTAENWLSSDFYMLTQDATYLEGAIDRAVKSCTRYKQKKLWWSPIAYNRFVSQTTAEVVGGIPTFTPNAKQSETLYSVFLASAAAYEAEKAVCPSIVWRQ